MKYSTMDWGTMEAVVNKLGGLEGVQRFLRDELVMHEASVKTKPSSEPEVVIDPIIRVDRSIRPSYPDWVKTVMHPELEKVGPAEYSAESIKQWLLEAQKTGIVTGNQIYASLKEQDNLLLKTCLGLRDLEEIQKKGIAFFRKYFKGKVVFGWAGVVRNRDGSLDVPYLCESAGGVVLCWGDLGGVWDSSSPALRHAS